MDIYPVDWHATDVGNQYTITVFGKTPDAEEVAAHIAFYPYFFVDVTSLSPAEAKLFLAEACAKQKALKNYCRIVERVTLWGFTNGTKLRLAQLAFASVKIMKWTARKMRDEGHTTYESSIDPLLRFFHVRNIAPATWINISSFASVCDPTSRAAKEVSCTFDRVGPSALASRPPLVFCSWDLETYSKSRRFPSPENEDDCIIAVASSFQRYGDPAPYRTLILALKETHDVEGVEVASFDDEADMLNAWFEELRKEKVDVMLGYNVDQFDWRYVHGRSLVCVDDHTGEPKVALGLLGRMREGGGALNERELNSGAYGQNKFLVLSTPGVMQIDLLQYLRKEVKLESYSLNSVSLKYLGDSKMDLPAGEIFDKFDGSAADRAVIAEYAAKDTVLPLQLLAKLCVFENLAEMANATFCPINYVLQRGQQIKVYSVLMKKARAMGYACPDNVGIGVVGKFTGATVLNAERGAYFDIVSGLDFCSLYPSIIRAWSLCYSTIVLNPKYDNLPGIEYYEIATDQGTFRFAQGFGGVLPDLLKDLAEHRKAAKKKMAEAKARGDHFAAAIHNGSQLAFKVTMNSAYGFAGANKGFLSCVPIAASVTATGRNMIMKTKGLVEELLPGSRVVYGDSVAGYTPLLVRRSQHVCELTTIERLAAPGDWLNAHGGKEAVELHGVEVWAEAGWTPVERVLRHRANKPMVRVLTHTGIVDVTADHSLLRADATPVKPSDVQVGDKLLHFDSYPPFYCPDVVTCTLKARIMGFFFGDGSAGIYDGPNYIWKLSNSDRGTMEMYMALCEAAYKQPFAIYDALKSSGVYSLVAKPPKDLALAYLEMMYAADGAGGRSKVVPACILGADVVIRRAFFRGMYDADGDKEIGLTRIDQKSQISAASIALLLDSLGYKTSFNDRTDKPQVFRTTATAAKQRVCSRAVKRIRPVSYDGYVYDLTTASGHFAAGVGRLVVHNTDSVMCILNLGERQHDMGAHFVAAQDLADRISATFPRPVELEFEKCYYPYLLFSKKRYAGLMYTKPAHPDYIDVKGLQLVRRDNCSLVKDVSTAILNKIMYERSPEIAIQEARASILRILRHEEPPEKFVVSKSLRSDYKNPAQPHLYVAKKIFKRTGSKIPSGVRVPYVIIEDAQNPDGLLAERAEDPDYVRENGLTIDVLHYIRHQLESPIAALLELLVDDPVQEVFGHDTIKPLLDVLVAKQDGEIKVAKRLRKNAKNNQHEITSFFKPVAK